MELLFLALLSVLVSLPSSSEAEASTRTAATAAAVAAAAAAAALEFTQIIRATDTLRSIMGVGRGREGGEVVGA